MTRSLLAAAALSFALLAAAPVAAQSDEPIGGRTESPLPPPVAASPTDGPPPELDVDQPTRPPREQVFVSPAGEPFRAPLDAPYPVADWFARADKDRDGVLTQAEFVADALAFFETLDTDKDGRVDGFENVEYEKTIAPEINRLLPRPQRPSGGGGVGGWMPWSRADAIWGRAPMQRKPRGESPSTRRQGAAQYGLLNEPHPVRGADTDIDGRISRAEAEAAATRRFRLLDEAGSGRLTLDLLPWTPAQALFETAKDDTRRKP